MFTRSKATILISVLATTVVGFLAASSQAFAQGTVVNYSSSYQGEHPLVAEQRAYGMLIENRRAEYRFRKEIQAERKQEQQERARRSLAALRQVTEQESLARQHRIFVYAQRIDRSTGAVAWPELLAEAYPEQVSRLNGLFYGWVRASSSGLGTRNYSEIQHVCRQFQDRLRIDYFQKHRFSTAEYLAFKKLIEALPEIATQPPTLALADNRSR